MAWTDRSWKPSGSVTGFNPVYYLQQRPKLEEAFKAWKGQRDTNLHYGDYVRANPDLDAAWKSGMLLSGGGPSGRSTMVGAIHRSDIDQATKDHWGEGHGLSRWDWGQHHYDVYGRGENRLTPQIVGGPGTISGDRKTMNTILTQRHGNEGPVNTKALNTWLKRHYDTYGRDAGLFGSEAEWYMSPGQQETRRAEELAFQEQLNQDMIAQQQASTKAMEEMQAKARRVKTSQTVGTGGAGQFRGKGLTTSENKRGGGSRQFRAGSPQFLATLNTGTGKGTGSKSTLNV